MIAKSLPDKHQDPTGCQFVSPLLHFLSNSLCVAWELSRAWPKAQGSCTMWGTQKKLLDLEQLQLS